MEDNYRRIAFAALGIVLILAGGIIVYRWRMQTSPAPRATSTPQGQTNTSTSSNTGTSTSKENQSTTPTSTVKKPTQKPVQKSPVKSMTNTTASANDCLLPSLEEKPSIPASASYLSALKTYRDNGYYIQFSSCMATPGVMTVKKGSKIMLDNRDEVARTIGVGGVKYSVPALGYKIITITKPGDNYVTCEGGRGVITVQQ